MILFTLNSTEVSEIIFDITSFYIPEYFFKISLIALIVSFADRPANSSSVAVATSDIMSNGPVRLIN